MEIKATNVNRALAEGLQWLKVAGVKEDSRNGPVLVSPEPVMTIYTHPLERVLFSPLRDANPFFHLMEALWMLAGRNDVAWPAQFAKQILQYSDDGKTMWGAYGNRWRDWFGHDQIPLIVEELKRNPNSRRAVLAMWDSYMAFELGHGPTERKPYPYESSDLVKALAGGKDVPCNTHVYFDAREGKLNMTVLCRSNDIWWGAYGANAVHFSVLQEYMAFAVGIPVGIYRQFSNNFHLYTNVVPFHRLSEFATDADSHDGYSFVSGGGVVAEPYPLISTSIEAWDRDLTLFMNSPTMGLYRDPFFNGVATPMYMAWHQRKNRLDNGELWARRIEATDWRQACMDWIGRRETKKRVTA